jgi:hypothetical protein
MQAGKTYAVELLRRQLIGACARALAVCLFAPVRAITRRRLWPEMTKSPPEGVSVGPKDGNIFVWEILIVGPAGTP